MQIKQVMCVISTQFFFYLNEYFMGLSMVNNVVQMSVVAFRFPMALSHNQTEFAGWRSLWSLCGLFALPRDLRSPQRKNLKTSLASSRNRSARQPCPHINRGECCLLSFTLSSWVSWFYSCKSRGKIGQVEVAGRHSSCEWPEIGCLCTFTGINLTALFPSQRHQ